MYVTPERIEKSSISIDDKSKPLHNILSDREYEVFKNLALGLPLTKIGELLDLNAGTIATYRGRILEKLNLTSNAELVRYALKNNLIP
jgi:DNA-binding NarL/FixJ family response regulator